MTDPERVQQATRSFLDEHPGHEETLQTLLEHERDQDAWAFEDAPVDSGAFGELVSRPFVEQTDTGDYRFADPAAIEAALEGETVTTEASDDTSVSIEFNLPPIDRRVAAALLAALALVVAARSLFFNLVFRDDYVVSPANDPYFYRYWQETLLEHSTSPFDIGMAATVGEETRSRPLTHALNWWFGALTGSPELVAVFLPVIAAIILALLVYKLTLTLTADHRIAIASILFLALAPVLVVYTSMAFLEHRPYQYVWLTVMVLALCLLAVDFTNREQTTAAAKAHARDPNNWLVAGALAIGVAAMAHTWGGSPLSFLPVAIYVGCRVVADCRAGVHPLYANAPAIAGVGIGSLLALIPHVFWGWHETIAALVPVLVAVGALGVALLATAWLQRDLPPAGLLAAEGVLAVAGLLLLRFLRPEDLARLRDRADDLLGREVSAETASLFAAENAVLFGPLSQIGLGFYLALVPLAVATYYVTREYDPAWLLVVCFTWFYFLIAALQVRFAAQLAIFMAIFAAIALVYLLGAVGLARKPSLFDRQPLDGPPLKRPESSTVATYLVVVIVAVMLFNVIYLPTLMSQAQYSDDQVHAVGLIEDDAAEYDRSFPANYVLSEWSDSRMFNYFVNGQSRDYGYAMNNYDTYLGEAHPDDFYDSISDRVGYLILSPAEAPDEGAYATLYDDLGVGNESVAHFQLMHTADELRVFAVVEGAVITMSAPDADEVTASTDLSVADESFTYERTGTPDQNGTVEIRVAYAGEYEVGGETVTVTEQEVREGAEVRVDG